jgi:hypothetical protein
MQTRLTIVRVRKARSIRKLDRHEEHLSGLADFRDER